MSNDDFVFNGIVNAAKHYRPEYEGIDPPLVAVLTDLDGHLPTSNSFMSIGRYSNPFQPSEIRKERREWKERQEEARREHKQNPMRYCCDKIRGIVPDYEVSFEDEYIGRIEHINKRRRDTDEFLEEEGQFYLTTRDEMTELERRVHDIEVWTHGKYEKARRKALHDSTKPEGMTMTQWKKEKSKKRKLQREEAKQRELDRKYVFNNSPQRMFEKMIDEIDCECEAEEMRVGKFCKTCILISKVRQYTLDLFNDGAEGRSSYI